MLKALFVVFTIATTVISLPTPADAQKSTPPEIVFPVVGDVAYTDTFGAPRDGGSRSHEGTDIMTKDVKGLPIVAAADGVVSWVDEECCHVAIDHDQGWSTWYIHLNNDTPGTDDGEGWGIAPEITEGAAVTAGQVIGWSGDSGNAEDAGAQLHFEIRSGGVAINPYPRLSGAPAPTVPGDAAKLGDFFVDDDDSVHESAIDQLHEQGITKGCNPPTNNRYCPTDQVTRGQLAAFLRRHLELPPSDIDAYADDDTSIFQADINALTAAGIGFGCAPDRFCPDQPLLRNEMAEFLVRAFSQDNPERYDDAGADAFGDDDGDRFETSINRLQAADVTVGCNPPANDAYCPSRPLTRAEMATFIIRASKG